MKSYRQGDEAGCEQAEDIARILLEHSDLPLLCRAHACIVLACARDQESLIMADEAVRLYQAAQNAAENTRQKVEALLEDAVAVREAVKQTVAARSGEAAAETLEDQATPRGGKKRRERRQRRS